MSVSFLVFFFSPSFFGTLVFSPRQGSRIAPLGTAEFSDKACYGLNTFSPNSSVETNSLWGGFRGAGLWEVDEFRRALTSPVGFVSFKEASELAESVH